MSEERLGHDLAYRAMDGAPHTTPMPIVLAHFFNHQTHHRGQTHCLLTGFGLDAPSFDLIMFQRETGMGMT
jgi:uncharacterized damage-inducible protein DinB